MNPCVQDLPRFRVPEAFRGRPGWYVQLWWIVQDTLFRWSPQFLFGWRRFLLRCFGAEVGKDVLIRPTARITFPWKVRIGDNSWVGDDAVLYSLGEINIGANTVISQRSYLCTGSHDFSVPSFDIFAKKISIEDEVWIATDVFVGPGVTIGRGTVVGARSSVLKSLPQMMVCVGSPAKPLKPRELGSAQRNPEIALPCSRTRSEVA
ncbi:MAG TPA: putative colanic acid biosynthesis acetyltransferase [Planctomycetota bacterium]|jgi:putative colanic acid biosynthesis acetyltransferase WcaF